MEPPKKKIRIKEPCSRDKPDVRLKVTPSQVTKLVQIVVVH